MIYVILIILLFVILNVYFQFASKFDIVDRVNERSSHRGEVIRGGGIAFYISVILYWIVFDADHTFFYFGFCLLGLISLLDDRWSLPNVTRFIFQLLSAILLLIEVNAEFPIWTFVTLIIMIIGFVNAYNFMDGINGMTVLYSVSIIIPIYILNQKFDIVDLELLHFIAISSAVFGFYNVRKTAKCFSGDVGSISLGLIFAFIIIIAALKTNWISIMVLVAIYGMDSGLTIVVRLFERQNIFSAHRMHIYQLLVNEMKFSHLSVSISYASLQFFISSIWVIIMFHFPSLGRIYFITILLLLAVVYILIRRKVNSLQPNN